MALMVGQGDRPFRKQACSQKYWVVLKSVGASLLAKRPLQPIVSYRLEYKFRKQACSHRYWVVLKSVGASLLAKRPLHPIVIYRLEYSFRKQACSHRFSDPAGSPLLRRKRRGKIVAEHFPINLRSAGAHVVCSKQLLEPQQGIGPKTLGQRRVIPQATHRLT